ncbi:MAG: VacJ family lipoprotein [Rhodospirillales bacterium]|nr:VacJ family lipoprotein [Rhodospirillales bacterium]
MARNYLLNGTRLVLAVAACSLLAACSTTQAQKSYSDNSEISDPLESVNRTTFAVNNAIDTVLLEPAARGYRAAVPKPARKGVRNFLRNLRSPINIANQVLQGDVSGAGNDLTRMVVNTLVGVGGLFDVAGSEGYEYEQEDFGQTLATWGVGHGPYLVLPILGPSSVRDATGLAVDAYADPLRLYLFNVDKEEWHYARIGMTAIDKREELLDVLEELEKNSFDYYAALRSVYYQRRAAEVRDEAQNSGSMSSIPDYDDGDDFN